MLLEDILIKSIKFENVDISDYPDFCDAFISKAKWKNGNNLSEEELDELNENYPEFVYENLLLCLDYN